MNKKFNYDNGAGEILIKDLTPLHKNYTDFPFFNHGEEYSAIMLSDMIENLKEVLNLYGDGFITCKCPNEYSDSISTIRMTKDYFYDKSKEPITRYILGDD